MAHTPIAEVEAKLTARDSATLRAIAALPCLGPYQLRVGTRAQLHSLYLDSKDFALARGGIALRLRRDGARWEATIKWRGRSTRALHHRPELTVPLAHPPQFPFELADPTLAAQLNPWLAGRALIPILVTDIDRQTLSLLASGTEQALELAEIALDEVEIRSSPEALPVTRYCEVEIERRQGKTDDLRAAGALLAEQFGLSPSPTSKFGQAMRLLHPRIQIGGSEQAATTGNSPAEEGARRIFTTEIQRWRRADVSLRLTRGPESLHDLRVSVRRLRTAVRSFAPVIPAATTTRLKRELEWLAHSLSPARDIEVQLQRLDHFLATAPPSLQPSLAAVRNALAERGEQAHHSILEILDARRYQRLLLAIDRFAARPPRRAADLALGALAARALPHAYDKMRKAAGVEPLTPAALHKVRIRGKRLRYELEFFRPLVGKRAGKMIKKLVRMQETLGSFHDAVVIVDTLQDKVAHAQPDLDHAQLLAIGALIGRELSAAEQLRASFHKQWRRIGKRKGRAQMAKICATLAGAEPPPEATD